MAKNKSQDNEKSEKPKYIFDPKPCPRCRQYNSIAVSTQGNIQYRKCKTPICLGNNFSVRGRPAEQPKAEEKQI